MKKAILFMLALMLALGTAALPAGAASAYKPVNGAGGNTLDTVLLSETLQLQWQDTPIPALIYTYSISQTPEIVSIGAVSAVAGAPTVQVGTAAAGASAVLDYSAKTEADVTRASVENGSTVTDTITVNFSGVVFSEPGIYRYTLTKAKSGSDADAATNDDPSKFIDVYISDENDADGKLSATAVAVSNAPGSSTKDSAYTDQYPKNRSDLTIAKTVSGSQASREQYFRFSVTLSSTVNGTVYPVDLTNAEAATQATVYDSETHTNPASITAAGTTAAQDFYLKHGQSIVIRNITTGIAYTVVEDASSSAGYMVSAEVSGDTQGVTNTAAQDGTVTDTALDSAATVTFTNAKPEITPTGVSLPTGASVIGILAAAALAAALLAGRRRKEDAAG